MRLEVVKLIKRTLYACIFFHLCVIYYNNIKRDYVNRERIGTSSNVIETNSVRIPTEIGDSSRYTLPSPAFRLRTDDFSSMHTTPRKMCPRHQEICCKNPFPEMLSFLGFGTRRLFNVGCFIDISGAKTIQKHRSSRQFTQTLRNYPSTSIQGT